MQGIDRIYRDRRTVEYLSVRVYLMTYLRIDLPSFRRVWFGLIEMISKVSRLVSVPLCLLLSKIINSPVRCYFVWFGYVNTWPDFLTKNLKNHGPGEIWEFLLIFCFSKGNVPNINNYKWQSWLFYFIIVNRLLLFG